MQMTPEERFKVRKGDNQGYWVVDYTFAENGGIVSPIMRTEAEAEQFRQRLIAAQKPQVIDGGTF
jgi:hypothetical protein